MYWLYGMCAINAPWWLCWFNWINMLKWLMNQFTCACLALLTELVLTVELYVSCWLLQCCFPFNLNEYYKYCSKWNRNIFCITNGHLIVLYVVYFTCMNDCFNQEARYVCQNGHAFWYIVFSTTLMFASVLIVVVMRTEKCLWYGAKLWHSIFVAPGSPSNVV